MNPSITGQILNISDDLGLIIDEFTGRHENFENFQRKQRKLFYKNVLIHLDKGVEREVSAWYKDEKWIYCTNCYDKQDMCHGIFHMGEIKKVITKYQLQQSHFESLYKRNDNFNEIFKKCNIKDRKEILYRLRRRRCNKCDFTTSITADDLFWRKVYRSINYCECTREEFLNWGINY